MTDPHTVKNRGLITVCVMLATVMQVLDMTIANVALPHMQGGLSAAQDTITWVLTSYIVAAAIATPLTGWLADRLGRKQLFLIAVVGFTVASLLCGVAMTLGEMVLFRLLQGVFGAALVPLSQAVLLDINPRERHAQAMAVWGAGVMVGPILGPTLGGWLTDSLNWRWVFFVNLPIGVLAFAGLLALLPANRPQSRRFDFAGFGLLAIGLGALQFFLDRGERQDWFGSVEIWVELFVAIGALWMFFVHLVTSEHAFLDRRLFTDANFMSAIGLVAVVGILIIATAALVPPLQQNLFGYSTLESGLVMAPRGGGTMIVMLLLGRISKYFDPRHLLALGLSITVVAMWWMTQFSVTMGWLPFVLNNVLQGLGIGLIFAPLSLLSLSTVEPELRTQAAALFSLMRNIGSSVGLSILSTALAQGTQINHEQLAEHISPFNAALNAQLAGAAAMVGEPYGGTVLAFINMEVTRQAMMIAYLNDFKIIMWMAIMSLPMLLLLRRPQPRPVAGISPGARLSSEAPPSDGPEALH